jgi:hypothetical protein
MSKPPKLTVRHLLDFYETFRYDEEVKKKPDLPTIVISLHVIKYFLGDPWIKKHLDPFVTRPGFMRISLDQTSQAEIQALRLVDLAELLINLQDIDGFSELTERIKTSDVESSLAELHVGRLLYINDANFRFVIPHGKKGNDYDLEITYPDGEIVCGETKCKIESTQLSTNTISNALQKARGQLPEDRPGIIFLMFPQQWLEASSRRETTILMVATAIEFFRGTSKKPGTTRVVSVKYYVEPLSYSNGIAKQGHEFKEVSNPHNKFYPERNWDLFHYRPNPGHWNALPEKWIRLFKFPSELGKHRQI